MTAETLVARAEKAWIASTISLMAATFACAAWYLCAIDDAGAYMNFFALPAYAILAAASICARLLWQRAPSDRRRLTAEYTAAIIFIGPLIDLFDPRSTLIEMELSGPFILFGLWCLILDEFMNLTRRHVATVEATR